MEEQYAGSGNQMSRTICNHGPELGDGVEPLDGSELDDGEALLKPAEVELDGVALFDDVLFDPPESGISISKRKALLITTERGQKLTSPSVHTNVAIG